MTVIPTSSRSTSARCGARSTNPSGGQGVSSTTLGAQVYSAGEPAPAWRNGGGFVVAEQQVQTPTRTLVVQGRSSLAATQEAIRALQRLLVPGVPAMLLLVALLT